MSLTLTSSRPTAAKRRSLLVMLIVLLALIALSVFVYYNVDKTVTPEDTTYIQRYLQGQPAARNAADLSFEEQIKLLQEGQQAVQGRTEIGEGIPHGVPREPKDLYNVRRGLCYDRSRVLEKIYMSQGFQTRHVALYADVADLNTFQEMTKPQIPSHATSEVLTKKGWLVVDPINPWMALDQKQEPYSLEKMNESFRQGHSITWQQHTFPEYDKFYDKPCTYVYGLYSRHGGFYPPYTPGIPDYNIRELLYNL